MSKDVEVSIREMEAWGCLKDPRNHTAAIGVRLIDNFRRRFEFVPNRMTAVGDGKVLEKLRKWLFSEKVRAKIAKNTRFVYDANASEWYDRFDIGGNVEVKIAVRCAGEYCHVAAYADVVPKIELSLYPCGNDEWAIELDGIAMSEWPRVRAKTKLRAREILCDYIDNEMVGRDDLVDE